LNYYAIRPHKVSITDIEKKFSLKDNISPKNDNKELKKVITGLFQKLLKREKSCFVSVFASNFHV